MNKVDYKFLIRPLSKLHLFVKNALFGIFCSKFFDHMGEYALKILTKICTKMAIFSEQSKFRKRSILFLFLFQSLLFCDQGAFGQFESQVMQLPISSESTFVNLEVTQESKGIELSKTGDEIIIKEKGIYYITASGQVNTLTKGAFGYVDFWVNKNGHPIAISNNRIYLSKFILAVIVSTQALIPLNAGDNVSMGFSTNSHSLGFTFYKPDNEPASSSFTVTIFKI